jgi:hypothetical protein
MIRRPAFSVIFPVAALTAALSAAGTELVQFPAGFETEFVRYQVVDRADRKIARFMYIDRASWDAAKAGQPLPYGAVVVMEDHSVRMKGEEPVVDTNGRMIPTDATTNVFVMEKRAGWGIEYPEEVRNGEWEYAWFTSDGTRSDRPMDRCFECHKGQEAEDFTFTTFKAVAAKAD